MRTFAPTANNDLALGYSKRGKKDLVLERDPVVSGAIQLFHRFQLFEAEWFLDTRQGVPYFRLILVKNPNLTIIREVLRKVLLSVAMVQTVESIEFDYNSSERTLLFTFSIIANDGRRIEGGSGGAFIMSGREIAYTTEIA